MRAAPAAGATRRRRFPHVLTALVSAVALFAAAPAAHAADAPAAQATTATTLPAPPFDDAGYWAVADRMQARLDGLWDEKAGYYRAGSGGVEPMLNAMMLLTHAVAAQTGHQGPARNDHRARLIALRLVTPGAPYVTRKPRARAGSQIHAPGWTNSMNDPQGGQHLVFDAEVVDGLVYAWKARAALQLPQSTADAIASAIRRTARGSFWRWPTVRLNQVNWYATMYAADATVTGDPTLLRRDLSAQLRHFVDGIAPRAGATGNLGPGDRFHYLPHAALNHPMNVDSAEYANIVLSFSRSYEQARRAGMKALSPSPCAPSAAGPSARSPATGPTPAT